MDIYSNRGSKMKWGGTDFKWGGRAPLAPPLATALSKLPGLRICIYSLYNLLIVSLNFCL